MPTQAQVLEREFSALKAHIILGFNNAHMRDMVVHLPDRADMTEICSIEIWSAMHYVMYHEDTDKFYVFWVGQSDQPHVQAILPGREFTEWVIHPVALMLGTILAEIVTETADNE